MKKQIEINGKKRIVSTSEEVLAFGLKLSEMVDMYNGIVTEEHVVKKFTDKPTAAKRLFEVLDTVERKKDGKPSVKATLRDIFTAHPTVAFALEELENKCGCSRKVLMDDIARLKNEAYAGKAGTLFIVRHSDGLYGLPAIEAPATEAN